MFHFNDTVEKKKDVVGLYTYVVGLVYNQIPIYLVNIMKIPSSSMTTETDIFHPGTRIGLDF